jgi:hypothetical protein
LDEKSVIRKFPITAEDGKQDTELWEIDVVLSYRPLRQRRICRAGKSYGPRSKRFAILSLTNPAAIRGLSAPLLLPLGPVG